MPCFQLNDFVAAGCTIPSSQDAVWRRKQTKIGGSHIRIKVYYHFCQKCLFTMLYNMRKVFSPLCFTHFNSSTALRKAQANHVQTCSHLSFFWPQCSSGPDSKAGAFDFWTGCSYIAIKQEFSLK